MLSQGWVMQLSWLQQHVFSTILGVWPPQPHRMGVVLSDIPQCLLEHVDHSEVFYI